MISKSFLLAVGLVALLATASGKSFKNSKDVVWFPNPNEDGTLIEARLYPDAETSRAGDINDIHFLLYTGDNTENFDELFVGDEEALANSHFLNNRPLKFMVHGFGGAHDHGFPMQTYKEFLKVDPNQNFILVNWTVLSASPDYFTAVQNAQLCSQQSANLLEFLIAEGAVVREDIHLLGFSLGGQVVGQIGSRVSEKLTWITSLDPALPLFDVAHLDNRTDPSDAHFVDVIHTAGNGILGYFDPLGTLDWYPNGGRYQPGCGADVTGSCAHQRAPAIHRESIIESVQGFVAKRCSFWSDYEEGFCDENQQEIMGHHTPHNNTGTFFLATNEESPYAQG